MDFDWTKACKISGKMIVENIDIESANEEIKFWRNKYLQDNELDEKYDPYFFAIPSCEFIQKYPIEHIDDIKRYINE